MIILKNFTTAAFIAGAIPALAQTERPLIDSMDIYSDYSVVSSVSLGPAFHASAKCVEAVVKDILPDSAEIYPFDGKYISGFGSIGESNRDVMVMGYSVGNDAMKILEISVSVADGLGIDAAGDRWFLENSTSTASLDEGYIENRAFSHIGPVTVLGSGSPKFLAELHAELQKCVPNMM